MRKSWNKTSQVNVNSDLWWMRGAGSNLKCKSGTLTKSQLSGQLLGITFGRILKAGLRFILLKMTPPKIYFTWRDLAEIYISWCDAAKIYFHWSFDFRSAAPLDCSAKKTEPQCLLECDAGIVWFYEIVIKIYQRFTASGAFFLEYNVWWANLPVVVQWRSALVEGIVCSFAAWLFRVEAANITLNHWHTMAVKPKLTNVFIFNCILTRLDILNRSSIAKAGSNIKGFRCFPAHPQRQPPNTRDDMTMVLMMVMMFFCHQQPEPPSLGGRWGGCQMSGGAGSGSPRSTPIVALH